MLALLLGLPALAAPSPDEAVVKAVSEAYGKPVPAKAICLEATELPDAFTGDPVAVGVTQRRAGCRLYGVLVDGAYTPLEEAARTSLGEGWTELDASQRGDLLAAWTREVLLAFDVLDESVPVESQPAGRGGAEITATFWQRTGERHVARHTPGRFVFDAEGHLSAAHRDQGTSWKTTFYVQEGRVEGVTGAQIQQALTQQGARLTRCMEEAWTADPTVEDGVQMQWMIQDGEAARIAVVGDGNEDLANCYGSALRRIQYPEAWRGKALWSFSIDRRKVD